MRDSAANSHKVKRGMDLPQTKLCDDDVRLIRALMDEREALRRKASELTNARIAEKFGVHQRTIDRISERRGWIHV